MPAVVFKNPGSLDINCLKTFGVSVKHGDNPIGKFGTGLKYALAVIARETDAFVTVNTDKNFWYVRSKLVHIRDKKFEQLGLMNYHDGGYIELPFTTDLGKNWELWQAFRELYSNCLDEGGHAFEIEEDQLDYNDMEDGFVYITVSGSEMVEIFRNKEEVFIDGIVVETSNSVKIREGQSRSFFYQGIKVADLPSPTTQTYDSSTNVYLTEDRTVAYSWTIADRIRDAIVSSKDPNVITRAVTAPKGTFERSEVSFNHFDVEVSEEFIRTVISLRNHPDINTSALSLAESKLPPMERFVKSELSETEAETLKQTCQDLLDFGLAVNEVQVIPVDNLPETGNSVFTDLKTGCVYIDRVVLYMSRLDITRVICSAVVDVLSHQQDKTPRQITEEAIIAHINAQF